MRPTSGLTFGGRYQLSSRVAIGGMGEVWQATDLVIGRTVAIKILKDEYLGDPGFLERFRAEARHAALVNHEGIANVFDYGEEDGSAFLVMELVPGEALSTILERERVLSSDRVLDIVAQTANALHAAHSAGLVHRDIKPGNLLITPEGRVKITDFGIARIADQVPLTATGQVMGTVQYLSPEQASGHAASPTTDIYSLGIVAYEALAGRRPFTGESQVAIAMAQINETPPELPVTVSEPVRNLVYSSIAKSPADRPASAAHLARAAQALRRGDVNSAAASVPGIIGAGSLALTAGANYGNPTVATRVIPATTVMDAPASGPIETQRRNPWTWPLVILFALLAVVLVATIIALLGQPKKPPVVIPSTSSSPTPSATPSATPSPAPTIAYSILKESDVKGHDKGYVERALQDLNLVLKILPGTPAPSADQVGLAYDVSQTGSIRQGTVIYVHFYGPLATPPAPTPATAPAGPYTLGQVVDIHWDKYTGCPAGEALKVYNFTIDNGGTAADDNPISAAVTDLKVTLNSPGDTHVTYTAQCGDTLTSEASQPLTMTVGP
ncbi:MAG: serine/threonine protein kinase [Ferruginibacter sp.]|uniref:protein kinase domain-containing protein n=1 Tax=Ferruginibacter sp. TaxID=1940288 RepID=UPI002659ED49|nr:protein kinase [Ferruginibacter sp.]MDB5280855.1 serine/threonine protein kinase [Ferruginibacter sp.]